MTRLRTIVANIVLVLQVLIVWVLIFEESVLLPSVFQSFGRMHPLLLHFPIGLLFIAALLYVLRKKFQVFPEDVYSLILSLGFLTTSVTTLM